MGRGWRWGWVPLRVRVSAGVTTGGRSPIPHPPPPMGDPRTVGAKLGTVPSGPSLGGRSVGHSPGRDRDPLRAGTGTPSGSGPGPPAGREAQRGRRKQREGPEPLSGSLDAETTTEKGKKKILELGGVFFFSSPFLARNQQVWNNNSAGARGGGGRPRSTFVGHPQEGPGPRWLWGHERSPESPRKPQITPFFGGRGVHTGGGGTPGHNLSLQPYIPCMHHLHIPIQHLASHTHRPCTPGTIRPCHPASRAYFVLAALHPVHISAL